MIQLPLFFLPFPPAPIILYRVLQCTHGLGHHPSVLLELARRRIVDLWDHDIPISGAPMTLVDVGKQCIWLFAVVEETEQSTIGTFWHDGLEETQQGSYTLSELYPCLPGCVSPSKPCENCPPASSSRSASSLPALLPRHTFRTAHAKFLHALREYVLDRILSALSLNDKDALYQKHSTGFLHHPSSKPGEWDKEYARENTPNFLDSYCVQLHLADGGIIVRVSPRLCSFLPLLPSAAPGTPVVLLPALVPVYYMTDLRGDSRAYGELWRSLKGHGFAAGDAEELVMCWCPLRKHAGPSLMPEQGAYCVWPRSLCVVSTSRDPTTYIPSALFVTLPTSNMPAANPQLVSLKSHPKQPPSIPIRHELGRAAERASSYIDACMRDRERVRDLKKAAEQPVLSPPNRRHSASPHSSIYVTSSNLTSHQHQLYPSPPESYPEAFVPLYGAKSDLDSSDSSPVLAPQKRILVTSSQLYSLRQATPLPHAADLPMPTDTPRRASTEQEKGIPARQGSGWQSTLDRTTEDLDDLTLITDDVFNYYDSPPHVPAEAEGTSRLALVIENSDAANFGEQNTSHVDIPPSICVPSVDGNSGPMISKKPALLGDADVRDNADFGALAYPQHATTHDPVSVCVKTSDVDSACSLRRRYTQMTDPRVTLTARLRTLKPSTFPSEYLSSAANSPDLYQMAPDNSGDDDPEGGLVGEPDDDGQQEYNISTVAYPDTSDIMPFALLTLPRILSMWLSLYSSASLAVDPAPSAVEDNALTTTVQGALFVLSIPTPLSPEAVIAEDELENLAGLLLPAFALEAVDGGIWPRNLLKRHPNDSKNYSRGILATLKMVLGSALDLMAVPPASGGSTRTFSEPFQLPLFSLVQNNEVTHVNPSALRFWSEIGLAPLRGSKDVNAFALFQPGDGCSSAALQSWLQRVSRSYEGRRLGAHVIGRGSLDSGVVSVRWSNIRHILDLIVSSCDDKSFMPVLYLIIPSDLVVAHPADYVCLVEALRKSQRFVHQFVPIDTVHRTSWAEDEINAFVTSTYDRCKSRLERDVHRREFEPHGQEGSWFGSPALTIAQSIAPQFRYSLNWETRGIDAANHHVLLHAAYGFSSSGKWLFAASIDQRGESRRVNCWDVDELDCGDERDDRVVLTLWNFIEETTQFLSAEWVTVVCKLGRLSFAEIKAWDLCIARKASHGKGLQHVTVMEAGESASFLSPHTKSLSEQAGDEEFLFAEVSPAYAIYSHLRLQLSAIGDAVLAERHDWLDGPEIEDTDSETMLPLQTSFFIYRISAASGAPPGADTMDWGALQLNTLLSWTSESSTSNVRRRATPDIQRDLMSSFNELAALAREQLSDSSRHWWPYHLLAIDIMSSASHFLGNGLSLELATGSAPKM